MTEEEIQSLKQKHGEKLQAIIIPPTEFDPETTVVIKRPPRQEYKRFRSMLFDDKQKPDAMETLARACVVYPDPTEFAQLLEERPGLADVIGGKAVDMAGMEGQADAKKL